MQHLRPGFDGPAGGTNDRYPMHFTRHTSHSGGFRCPFQGISPSWGHSQYLPVSREGLFRLPHLHQQVAEQFPGGLDCAGRHGMLLRSVLMVRRYLQHAHRVRDSVLRPSQPCAGFLSLDGYLARPVSLAFLLQFAC